MSAIALDLISKMNALQDKTLSDYYPKYANYASSAFLKKNGKTGFETYLNILKSMI